MIIFLTQTGNFCTGCVQGELEGGRNCPENTGKDSARVDMDIITSFVVSYYMHAQYFALINFFFKASLIHLSDSLWVCGVCLDELQ